MNEHHDKLFEKSGFRINGWRIPYPILLAGVYALMTSSVSLYQIQQLQTEIDKIAPRTENVDSSVQVLENRVGNLEESVRHHRWREHKGFSTP